MNVKLCLLLIVIQFDKMLNGRDVDDEVSFTKVLLDSGIYQGDLKRGVPHGQVRL